MELRRRKRRRMGCASVVIHGAVIVTTILTTVTFWNVIHVVHRMVIPITITTNIIRTISINAIISITTLPSAHGYTVTRKQQQAHRHVPFISSWLHLPSFTSTVTFATSSSSSSYPLTLSLRHHPDHSDHPDDTTITHQNQTYTLMTWNLLAPVYASQDKYSYCSKLDLDWNQTRCPKILQTITSTDADIVCLQEVQIDTWYTDFLPYFQTNTRNDTDHLLQPPPPQQYTCILQNVTRNHPIACAILLKSSKFQIHTMESRSRALLLVLQTRRVTESSSPSPSPCSSVDSFTTPLFDDTPASFLYIANVHLDARYDQDSTRYNQIKSLLHRIEYHWQHNSKNSLASHRPPPPPKKRRLFISDTRTEASLQVLNENSLTSSKFDTTPTVTSFDNNQSLLTSSESASPIMIIAGDFNMVRTNPIYTLLSTGQYQHEASTKKSTPNKNSRDRNQFAIQLPFLPLKDVYNSKYDQKLHQKLSKVPSKNCVMETTTVSTIAATTHSIHSVNHSAPLVLRRTFAGGSILDYIWIHADRVCAVPWMIDPISSSTANGNHHLEISLAPPLRFRWPSPDQPSDHVPIGIQFCFTSTLKNEREQKR